MLQFCFKAMVSGVLGYTDALSTTALTTTVTITHHHSPPPLSIIYHPHLYTVYSFSTPLSHSQTRPISTPKGKKNGTSEARSEWTNSDGACPFWH